MVVLVNETGGTGGAACRKETWGQFGESVKYLQVKRQRQQVWEESELGIPNLGGVNTQVVAEATGMGDILQGYWV